MKVGIYHEPSDGMGGAEYVVAVMANILAARGHEVEIVHHHAAELNAESLRRFFELSMEGVGFRRVALRPADVAWHALPIRRKVRRARQWEKLLSRPYDVFIANVHVVPPRCYSRFGVIHLLFPLFDHSENLKKSKPDRGLQCLKGPIRRWYTRSRWANILKSYQLKLAISQFSADWAKRYWSVTCKILYPPVPTEVVSGAKANAIVSFARFTKSKQQEKLVEIFRDAVSDRAPGWEAVFVGGVSEAAADQLFLRQLKEDTSSLPVRFVVNASREQVRTELGRAKIFWHAMGIGINEKADPHIIEHFGIAAVEAMAAGCVPLVPNHGGQAEIVVDQESGYTCGSAEIMAERAIQMIESPDNLEKVGRAARDRAELFSKERFADRFLSELSFIAGI